MKRDDPFDGTTNLVVFLLVVLALLLLAVWVESTPAVMGPAQVETLFAAIRPGLGV